MEIVDSAGSVVLAVSKRQQCSQFLPLERSLVVVSGARHTKGWVLSVIDASASTQGIVGIDSAGGVAWRVDSDGHPGDPRGSLSAHLIADDGRAVVAGGLRWPFAWVRYGWEGTPLDSGSFDSVPTERRVSVDPTWISLPTVPLDVGVLQVIANPTSDERVMVRYDRSGEARKVVVLDGALGFLASAPRARLVAALRRTDKLEIVLYHWDWQWTRGQSQ